jgi:crotonobetainyl-CoA:carnitine CoA-transferase CaiB-like acyl-CoA transferase
MTASDADTPQQTSGATAVGPNRIGGTRGLSGIRVLELGEMVSAPYAAKLLADHGADVIKVEPPGGDPARHRGPYSPESRFTKTDELFTSASQDRRAVDDPDASGLYLALNGNKRSVVIGVGDDDRKRLADLVAAADIVITNLDRARLAELGLDLDELLQERPELVVCAITPFGLTGPYADYRAEELTVAHGGGWAYQCPGGVDDPELPPLKVFGHQSGFHAGTAAATAALAAYDRSERTGRGDLIDFSSMAHVAGMLEAALIATSYMGEEPSRLGSRLLNPWMILQASPEDRLFDDWAETTDDDDLIFVVTVEQDQWERLVEFMGRPDWATGGLFDTFDQRLENDDLLRVYLGEWAAAHQASQLWHGGQKNRICFAPVLTMAALERQEHLADRDFFIEVDHPTAGTVTHLAPPFRSSPSLRAPVRPAPLLDPVTTPIFGPRRPRSTPQSTVDPARPLDGVKVLDFSWVWAGPYCTFHLAALGAEVIKVESALRPGLGRRLPLHPPDVAPTLNTSAYFNQWDQGKSSCRLDLSKPEGQAIARALADRCDVVIENFATGVMERLGLGYHQLSATNPGLIMASISGYGSSGPLKEYMGYGPTTGPLSGLSSLTGYEGGPPQELGISVGDPAAGIATAFAICAALTTRRVSGEGCYIDTSLWEATASHAVEGWMAHAMGAEVPARMGNRDPMMAPHGAYRTGDRYFDAVDPPDGPDPGLWITIACADDDQWKALAAIIEPDLTGDERFATVAGRKKHEDELDRLLSVWVYGQDRWTLTGQLQAAGIAAFPSMSTVDLLDDAHLAERGYFERFNHYEVGRRVHTGIPWRSTVGPNGVTRPAPLLGQHTDTVLSELLGLTTDQIQDLRQRGITA